MANSQLLSALLPVIDDFDRAQDTIPRSKSKKEVAWLDGLELVIKKLRAILEGSGVQIIEVGDENGFRCCGPSGLRHRSRFAVASWRDGSLIVAACREGGADAVLAASIFHFGTRRIMDVKEDMATAGLPMRLEHPSFDEPPAAAKRNGDA